MSLSLATKEHDHLAVKFLEDEVVDSIVGL